MSHLLDTVVVSELRKRAPNPNVVTWARSVNPEEVYLSVATIAEIEIGIERQRQPNPEFAAALAVWLSATLRLYSERILPLDVAVARRWGQLAARLGNASLDLAIAATALEHGLTVVTRNVAHFAPTGAEVVNPFEAN